MLYTPEQIEDALAGLLSGENYLNRKFIAAELADKLAKLAVPLGSEGLDPASSLADTAKEIAGHLKQLVRIIDKKL